MNPVYCDRPIDGVGIGLRDPHIEEIISQQPKIPWFEALSDNYLHTGGVPQQQLIKIREHYPLVLHGVNLSIGAEEPLNPDYLKQLKALIDIIEPAWVSDHLCWVSHNQHYFHDLLPLCFTQAKIKSIVQRIQQVQEYLGRQILLENISTYLTFAADEMNEWEFLQQVVEGADCFILLDVNNTYVNSYNHRIDPLLCINTLDKLRVKQFHLAGFEDCSTHLLDTHGAAVSPEVWQLYEKMLAHFGSVPTLIEWDNNIPRLEVVLAQAEKAAKFMLEPCNA